MWLGGNVSVLFLPAGPDKQFTGSRWHEITAAGHAETLQQQKPGETLRPAGCVYKQHLWALISRTDQNKCSLSCKEIFIVSSPRPSPLRLPRGGSASPSSLFTQWFWRSPSIGWWLWRPGPASVTSWSGSCSSPSAGLETCSSTRSGVRRLWRRLPGHKG